jgi:hypothetical protein
MAATIESENGATALVKGTYVPRTATAAQIEYANGTIIKLTPAFTNYFVT